MKYAYVSPKIEIYKYQAENGYANTIALHRDYVLVEGNDNNTLRSSEEISNMTDVNGEYVAYEWN